MKESLEFLLGDRDISLVSWLALMLLPLEQGLVFKECGGKGYAVQFYDTGGSKIVFTLLAKVEHSM